MEDQAGDWICLQSLSVSSLIYYAWWNPLFIFLPLASAIFNFLWGKKSQGAENPKFWVIPGIILNCFFWDISNMRCFSSRTSTSSSANPFDVPQDHTSDRNFLFTFQQITYLADLGKGDDPKYSFSDYLLFVTFFPQLIAGPIVHHKEMMPQFQNIFIVIFIQNLSLGMTLFVIGLSKKVLLPTLWLHMLH